MLLCCLLCSFFHTSYINMGSGRPYSKSMILCILLFGIHNEDVFALVPEILAQEPEFLSGNANVTVIAGSSAILPCGIENLNQYSVVWTHPSSAVLTINDLLYTGDTRITIDRPFVNDWSLGIRDVQSADSGQYTCQISTTIKRFRTVNLNVIEEPSFTTTAIPSDVPTKTYSSSVSSVTTSSHVQKTSTQDVIAQDPEFLSGNANITVMVSNSAVLPCKIANLNRYKVMWTDPLFFTLTFNDRRIIDDARITVHRPFNNEWSLGIRDVQLADKGQYKCQVNTSPVRFRNVYLDVLDTTTPPVTLERHDISCDDDSITAFIPEDLLPAGVTLEWRDRGCTITENSTHFVSTISHSGCGTSVNMTTDSVIFENEITVSTATNVSGLVDFGGSVSVIPVRCVYPRKELSVVSYLPNNAPRFFEKRTGHFKLNMELYETSQFQNAIQNLPAKVRLQSDVNIRVSLSGNLGQFGVRLEKCMATKSPAPYDVNVYKLIEHGCPVQTHVKILNSPTTEVRFTMKAFEFTNSASAEVYIHCEASVCAAGAPECISNCASSVGRRRRDLSHQSHLVSAGPVLVQATEDNSKEKVTTLLTGVFGVVALGAVVLAIIGWRRKPTVKSVDYS